MGCGQPKNHLADHRLECVHLFIKDDGLRNPARHVQPHRHWSSLPKINRVCVCLCVNPARFHAGQKFEFLKFTCCIISACCVHSSEVRTLTSTPASSFLACFWHQPSCAQAARWLWWRGGQTVPSVVSLQRTRTRPCQPCPSEHGIHDAVDPPVGNKQTTLPPVGLGACSSQSRTKLPLPHLSQWNGNDIPSKHQPKANQHGFCLSHASCVAGWRRPGKVAAGEPAMSLHSWNAFSVRCRTTGIRLYAFGWTLGPADLASCQSENIGRAGQRFHLTMNSLQLSATVCTHWHCQTGRSIHHAASLLQHMTWDLDTTRSSMCVTASTIMGIRAKVRIECSK